MEERKLIPGLVWKKSENYQKAYKLQPFDVPAEWLDLEFKYGVDETFFEKD